MKVVLAFDSFKGSLSSAKAGAVAARAIGSVFEDAICDVIPLADGGEGTVVAAVDAASGTYETLQVTGPLGEPASAVIGLIRERESAELTAVLEVASICGITMVPAGRLDPVGASTRGVGEAVMQLLDCGIRRFVVGLGGSATNDGGMGMLAALGAVFRDSEGRSLSGCGGELQHAVSVRLSSLDPRLADSAITVATDVSNPLCGPDGATMIYGKQKGASPEQQAMLDKAMGSYAALIEAAAGASWQSKPGAGAAGGLGFAMLAIGGVQESGADWLMSLAELRERVRGADWVLTGEGRSDSQTLYGKLPIHVAAVTEEAGSRCILLSGSLGDQLEELEKRFHGCFSIVKEPATLEACINQAEALLELTVRQLFRLLREGER